MNERQKRLNEVYEYLRKHQGIHTQTEFADCIRYSRSVISSALNGNEDYLTDKLFRSISKTFPNLFNITYLLEGVGKLLKDSEPTPAQSFAASTDDAISSLKLVIQTMQETIDAKQETITLLKQKIIRLENLLNQKRRDDHT